MNFYVRMLPALILAVCSMQTAGQQTEDQLSGAWLGVLNAGGQQFRIVFNISVNEDRSLEATLDSPDQGTMAIPMGEVSLSGDSVRIEAPIINGYYMGKVASDGSIDGMWHQNGMNFKLDLERQEEAIVLNRPQEPRPPFPYREEEVTFENIEQGFTLGGTLTLPEGSGPFPAAILVSGSGAQNRDQEIYGHRPFKLIADYLTRNGIAVLRYDDRGAGASGGNAAGSTTEDHAEDARAAISYLSERSDIDHAKIGVIGHSEGGLIAFLLASSHRDIAYIVSLAGPGVDGKSILLDQSDHIARLSGAGDAILEDNWNVMSGVYDIMVANGSYTDWKEETLAFTSKFYSEKLAGNYSDADIERGKENLLASIPEPAYAWMRYFVMFDPAPLFGSIACPVLALNGEKDCQVLPEKNISAIEKGLKGAGNTEIKTMILPGLNHLFQNCETGLPNEYGIIEETFDPETLALITEWIWDRLD